MDNPLTAGTGAPSAAQGRGGGQPAAIASWTGTPAGIGDVPEPDAAAATVEHAAAHRRARALDLALGSLGKLSDVTAWLAAVQGTSPPRPITRPRAILLAADHGIAEAGLYPWPAGATARRLAAVAAGAAPLAVLARRAGVGLRLVDLAVATPPPDDAVTPVDVDAPVGDGDAVDPGDADAVAPVDVDVTAEADADVPAAANLDVPAAGGDEATAEDAGDETAREDDGGYRVRAGNGRIDRDDALTVAEAERAFALGRRLADEEIDAGADLLIPGALGVGADTAAAVVVAALRDHEPIDVVDRGDGTDDARWMLRTAAIRDALRRARPFAGDARSVLRVAGGADLAAIAGVLVQAALRRTPVIIDGPAACAAALAAERIAPGARAWWRVGGDCPDPAARHAVEALSLAPLLDLKIRADDGTGAFAAAALIAAAVEAAADLDAAAAELTGSARDEATTDTADIT